MGSLPLAPPGKLLLLSSTSFYDYATICLSIHLLIDILVVSMCMLSHFSCVWLFATLWTVAHQAPPSMGFSKQEYWSGLPFPSPKKGPGSVLGFRKQNLATFTVRTGIERMCSRKKRQNSISGRNHGASWVLDLSSEPAACLVCDLGLNPVTSYKAVDVDLMRDGENQD